MSSAPAPPPPPDATTPQAQSAGNVLSICAMVCGGIAIGFVPIVLGPVGIVLGIVGRTRGERLSTWAIVVAAVGMVLGFILGAIVFNASRS